MSYTVVLGRHAEKALASIPDQVVRRIDAQIRILSKNPFPPGVKKLQGEDVPGWRVRVGDYRMLYTVDPSSRVVHVYRIAHRSEVYR